MKKNEIEMRPIIFETNNKYYFVDTTICLYSLDFLRQLKDYINWHEDLKKYVKIYFGTEFYKEMFGDK